VSFCLVPSRGITQAPRDILPAYVCPFTVRSPCPLLRGFSRQRGISRYKPYGPEITSRRIGTTDLPVIPAYSLQAALPIAARPILLRHPIVITRTKWCRNVNLLPIDYAVRPRLRDRLTLSGLTLLRKPWAYGEQSSHLLYRYLCRQSHFYAVHQSLRSDFTPHRTLPYHLHGPQAT
jgi:hypothetical protein